MGIKVNDLVANREYYKLNMSSSTHAQINK